MVCYPYQSVFYFCFHWKLDINGSDAIPLVSDTGERLQWNLTPFKIIIHTTQRRDGGTHEHTHKKTNYPHCSFNLIFPVFILFLRFPRPPSSVARTKQKFMSILYLSCGRKKTPHSKWCSQWCPEQRPCPLGPCGAAVINGCVTLTLSHFSGRWRRWPLSDQRLSYQQYTKS